MPERLVITLGLPILARLQLSYGDRMITGVLKPGTLYALIEQVRLGNISEAQGRVIAAQSPFWMPIRAVERDGAVSSLPLRDGYFVIDVPKDVYEGDYHHLMIEWFE